MKAADHDPISASRTSASLPGRVDQLSLSSQQRKNAQDCFAGPIARLHALLLAHKGGIEDTLGALSRSQVPARVARRADFLIVLADAARIAEGPGGPAEMVPGQHHVRMNMYIAQAKNGRFEIVESLGAIDPDEAMVPSAAEFGRGPIA